ncbi:MAG: NAD-dependent epimerase/dehydratase family protein, partial [Spirochaetota bacterium]|nr:NAD-dependent epimerase/dehydratase family protein [Spirochaetota bacterium]
MKKEYILITGATGLIGSHVVYRLVKEKLFNIIAIVRKSNNYKNVDVLKQSGIIIHEGNFYDKQTVEKIFSKYRIQYVLHIAALRG